MSSNNNNKKKDDKNILDKSDLKNLIQNIEFDEKFFRSILDKILIPRSVDSTGHETVRQYIKNTLRDLNSRWHVEEDVFRTRTPAGQLKFHNIIATYVPEFGCVKSKSSLKRTILACHYDSLKSTLVKGGSTSNIDSQIEQQLQFIGATDAAVSCSLMLYLAHKMNDYLGKLWLNYSLSNRTVQLNTLQLIFFDGEEIIRSDPNIIRSKRYKSKFPQTDSLFGSKHLANKWEKISNELNEQQNHRFNTTTNDINNNNVTITKRSRRYILCDGQNSKKLAKQQQMLQIQQQQQQNENPVMKNKKNSKITEVLIISPQDYHTIDDIKLFILFDLIGGSSSRFYNTNLNTSHYFQQLIQIEKSFVQFNNETKKTSKSMNKNLFQQNPAFMVSFVRDDHLPFIIRNVPVLHLIPHPFPRIWHSMDDNLDNLNFNSISRFVTIMQIFLLNYFGLV
uniref:glutaminyl-peptide cyclotransferase n=1 Tax=Dermatophagoides pteronyssinus TaxID=6956 RepID=A0A6P6YH44_DERPT|nr:glutaminyl-peptide cyclotransferase-like [Dermatophagoides pteronyssinus]